MTEAPMVREPSRDEVDAVGRVAQAHLDNVVFPIVMKHELADGEGSLGLGSGFVIDFEGKHVLVTACHNFEEQTKGHPVSIGVGRHGLNDRSTTRWFHGATVHFAGGGGTFDTLDVAVVKASREQVAELGIEAVPHTSLDFGPFYDHEPVVVHGYPYELAEVVHGENWRILARSMTYMTQPVPASDWDYSRHTRDRHHLLQYKRDNAYESRDGVRHDRLLPDAGGLSGCAVWSVREGDGVFSYKDLRLHGLVYAQLRHTGRLLCNNAVVIVGLIRSAFPELAPLIDADLERP